MRKPDKRANQRKIVFERAKGCCEYCQSQARFSTQTFSVEHIIPKSRGGANELNNLALACQGCNSYKYNHIEGIDPVSRKLVVLYHPRKEPWQEHFIWDYTGTLIIGLTSTGRATVERLRLNREGLVNLRRILYTLGEHPPLSIGNNI